MFNISLRTLRVFKQFKGLFNNRWAISVIALLTVQQLIESSATLWLVTMMQKITAHENFFPYLYTYLLSLLVPYIPGCLANICKINWKQEAQRSFIQAFVQSNRNQIGEWSNKNLREEKLSILTTEGPNTLHTLIDYFYDMVSYLMSVIFVVCALSIVVEPLFGVVYFFSLLTVLVVMKIRRRTQRKLTQQALTARIGLYQSLLAAWDNVLLGNSYNFKLWEDKTTEKMNKCLKRNVELERFDQILAITIALITAIPCLSVVVHYAYVNRFDNDKLIAFLVTLPMLFMILSYTYMTLSLLFRWAMHRNKLTAVYKAIQPIKHCQSSMQKKVKWPKINITPSSPSTVAPSDHISVPAPFGITDYQDLINKIPSTGRLTLRGENGAGKSTLLMLLKNSLADKAFFLPTQNQLSFLTEANKYSTGESMKNRLLEVLEKEENVDVFLLDEWDANLDKENEEILTTIIKELSAKKCVIEVRHR